MNPPYIAKNLDELFDAAPADVQHLIEGDEVNKATAILGKTYNLPVNAYVALSNVISFILIGALEPKDVLLALQDLVKVSPEDAYKIATDLEKSILEKARISILGKAEGGVKELVFQGERSPDELRKEILDTTKRESGMVKDQSEVSKGVKPAQKKPFVLTPGSRSQLLEQLQILGSIPNDEEVEARLSHIQEQIASIEKKEDVSLDQTVALEDYMFGDQGVTTAKPKLQAATYSTAPTKYNVDPYREISE
ncbi:MAG: hypothetical protein WC444_03005 [Candidatus Paceibacterota bacterium]